MAAGNRHALSGRFLLPGAQHPFAWVAELTVPRYRSHRPVARLSP
ncbi:hypothetical protein NJ7G_2014 [Natrinema sp. J7-2]|nr:hypothetical protein NJ7G_2014 [Natrinema sp. J7-2]